MVSIIFYFHPYLGKISNLTNIFQMGWNHQLDDIYINTETLQNPTPFTHFFSFRHQFPKLSQAQDENLLGFPPPKKKGKKESQTSLFTFLFGRTIPFSFQHTQVLNKSDIPPSSNEPSAYHPSVYLKNTPPIRLSDLHHHGRLVWIWTA